MNEFSPRSTRRAFWHNYRSRCIYMITISKNAASPTFSHISGTPQKPEIILTPLGTAIEEELFLMCNRYEEMSILNHIIMPDHIHFVVFAQKPTEYHLGTAIGSLKGACSLYYQNHYSGANPLFARGFNDRILFKKGQLKAMTNYVDDNPRRLLIKRNNPDLFSRRNKIVINGVEYDAMGNIFLLRNPLIEQVRVSSKFTPDQLTAYDKKWKFTISECGSLVSPFISPAEKYYRDLCIDNGGSLILLEQNGLSERYKPGGKYFDLCAEGRLLIVAPTEHQSQRKDLTRRKALFLNDLAASIAAGNFEAKLRL